MTLTVFSILRNGILNGYPFVEAYGSWLENCDRLVLVDGRSSDGTRHVLDELARVDSRVEVYGRRWPETSHDGSSIAELTNFALELAASSGDLLMYVQADEVYTPGQRTSVRAWDGGAALEFAGCINFWNGFDRVLANDFPMHYVRLLRAEAAPRAIDDGFTFVVEGEVDRTPEQILHYGWCFPSNILQKHVSHSRLYANDPGYRIRGWLARAMLRRGVLDRQLLDALAPQYRPVTYSGEHPECMQHVLQMDLYDPYVGLGLLRQGVRW